MAVKLIGGNKTICPYLPKWISVIIIIGCIEKWKENNPVPYRIINEEMDVLLEILSDMHPEVDFETCDSLIDDGILDSFDIVSLISEISENFDVVISAENIIPENFNSAQALYALITRLEEE